MIIKVLHLVEKLSLLCQTWLSTNEIRTGITFEKFHSLDEFCSNSDRFKERKKGKRRKTKTKRWREIKSYLICESQSKLAWYFMSLFWNYPARSKDKVRKKQKQKQKSDEKFQTVSCQFPQKTNEDKKQKTKKKVTRNFRRSLAGFLCRLMKKNKKQKKKWREIFDGIVSSEAQWRKTKTKKEWREIYNRPFSSFVMIPRNNTKQKKTNFVTRISITTVKFS